MQFKLEILKKYINNSSHSYKSLSDAIGISERSLFRKVANCNFTIVELCAIVNTLVLSKDQILSILGL